jgi:hypothetical protein
MHIHADLTRPSAEYSVMPFWFWNDDLDGGELIRQMDDFQRHNVDGFVIHPRVGLPRHLGWMSDDLLDYYRIVIEEAHQRGMKVVLYDEGMYPSGSSSGQVVAANPAFACRCLSKIDLHTGELPELQPGVQLVAVAKRQNGELMAVVDRPANSFIRGLHYIDDGPTEDEPPAADLLNPQAVAMFIHLVYDRFADHFGSYFGGTIMAIFTDEPGLLGRSREREVYPGTRDIMAHINRLLGYDFSPHLPALWYEDEPDASKSKRDFAHAVSLLLEETYYQPLYAWCEAHGLALTGHPAKGEDLGALRYFHIPGQDLVWRWVLPDEPSALEGSESTQAKCASSAMIHYQRRRNANECCGAYGHELSWDELNWLARWAFVRGTNLLYPHAFYYSVRGLRREERPPDVGPHSPWWERFPEYAMECRRLSWINTDSKHLCHLAILGQADFLPWRAAKTCFHHQYDFNYIEERDLLDRAVIDEDGIHLAGMTYEALILDHLPSPEILVSLTPLEQGNRIYNFPERGSEEDLLDWLAVKVPKDFAIRPATAALRIRRMVKGKDQYFLLFNEEHQPVDIWITLPGLQLWHLFDAVSAQVAPIAASGNIHLEGYELKILIAQPNPAAA